jgi:hypothetical protein
MLLNTAFVSFTRTCLKHFSFRGGFFLSDFNDRFSKNAQNTKFHENPSSGNRVVPCGQTDTQRSQ